MSFDPNLVCARNAYARTGVFRTAGVRPAVSEYIPGNPGSVQMLGKTPTKRPGSATKPEKGKGRFRRRCSEGCGYRTREVWSTAEQFAKLVDTDGSFVNLCLDQVKVLAAVGATVRVYLPGEKTQQGRTPATGGKIPPSRH